MFVNTCDNYTISLVLHIANCDFSLSQTMICIGEDLDIEPKLTEHGSTSNDKRRFILIGAISSMLISGTYNPTHSPYSVTPSCPMSALKKVFPRFVQLSIVNDNLEGSLKNQWSKAKRMW